MAYNGYFSIKQKLLKKLEKIKNGYSWFFCKLKVKLRGLFPRETFYLNVNNDFVNK